MQEERDANSLILKNRISHPQGGQVERNGGFYMIRILKILSELFEKYGGADFKRDSHYFW